MKRSLCLILALLLVLPILGCSRKEAKIEVPLNFYYLRSEPTYGAADSLIAAQVTEGRSYDGDTLAILNSYLRGPSEDGFASTFPASTKVLEMTVEGGTVYLSMNSALARFSGMDLTAACACLTLTVLDLTGADAVTITASGETLDGESSVTMTRNNVILYENPSQ